MVDFSGPDIGDDAQFMRNFGRDTGVKNKKTLKTSNAGAEDNGIAMTSYSVSDILQGVHAYKPQGLATNAFNQLMTSQLQSVGSLNAETGQHDGDIAQKLAGRKHFLPDDLMNGSFLDVIQNGGAGYNGAPGAPVAPGDLANPDAAGVNDQNRKYTDTAGVTGQRATSAPGGKSIMVGAYKGVVVNMSAMASWKAMVDAAQAVGVDLSTGSGGYRDAAGQLAVRRTNCGTSDYAVYQMPSGQCHPPTARPGTSQHEWGTAVDVNSCPSGGTKFNWLAANAATYGWKNLPSESWHWSVDGS